MSYKVILVDDKPLVLRSLKETINWRKLDCIVVGQALNGIEAIELVDSLVPDIVISDIKMSGIDGLQLTEYINKNCTAMKVIIITGYQEFDYAKKAISLGVVDLILKPIDNSVLENVIKKAIDEIARAKELIEYQNRLTEENVLYKDHYHSSLDKLKSQVLYNLLQRYDDNEILNTKEMKHLDLDNGCYFVAVTRIRSAHKDIRAAMMKGIIEIFNSLKEISGIQLVDTEADGDMVIMFIFYNKTSARQAKLIVKRMYEEVQNRIMPRMNTRFCCVVSQLSRDINSLKYCYKQALEGLNSSYFSTKNVITFMDKKTLIGCPSSIYIIEDLDNFYRNIDMSSMEDLQEDISILVNKIVSSSNGSEFRIKCLLSEICITLSRHYLLWVIDKNEYQMAVNKLLDEIDNINALEEAEKYLNDYIKMIKESIKKDTNEYSSLVKDALKYINENFSQEISLETMSEHINANPSYLSRLLKKETGESFVEIVTKIRIDTAKYLLLQSGSRIVEVCTQVGYKNYAYFYQVFKRMIGVTPTEYKKTGKKI